MRRDCRPGASATPQVVDASAGAPIELAIRLRFLLAQRAASELELRPLSTRRHSWLTFLTGTPLPYPPPDHALPRHAWCRTSKRWLKMPVTWHSSAEQRGIAMARGSSTRPPDRRRWIAEADAFSPSLPSTVLYNFLFAALGIARECKGTRRSHIVKKGSKKRLPRAPSPRRDASKCEQLCVKERRIGREYAVGSDH